MSSPSKDWNKTIVGEGTGPTPKKGQFVKVKWYVGAGGGLGRGARLTPGEARAGARTTTRR